MTLEQIKDRLARLNALVERWDGTDINAIERDLALEHLRAIYDELSSFRPSAAPQPFAVPSAAPAPADDIDAAAVGTPDEQSATLIDDPIDIDTLLGLSPTEQTQAVFIPATEPEEESVPEPEEELAPEPEEEPAPEPEEVPAPEPEEVPAPEAEEESAPEPEEESAPEPEEEPAPEPEEEPAPEPKEEPAPEPEEDPAPEPKEEPAPEPEEVPAPEPEEVPAPEPTTSAPMGGLFDINEIPIRSKRRRNIMISLYEEPVRSTAPTNAQPERRDATAVQAGQTDRPSQPSAPVAAEAEERLPARQAEEGSDTADNIIEQRERQQAEPQPQRYTAPVTPQPAPTPRLADVLAGEVTTLADSMIPDKHAPRTAANTRIDDIRKAIGINDRFLMIRDLFNGDAQMFENTITTINEFDDLDECMIYLVENFAWNPDSDGARLLMSLIERKLA